MKVKDKIKRLVVDDATYDDEEEMSEVLNAKFQSVFVKESKFIREHPADGDESRLDDILVTKEEIQAKMTDLDKRKAMGPDNISGWVLQECVAELSYPLWLILRKSLREGKLPKL